MRLGLHGDPGEIWGNESMCMEIKATEALKWLRTNGNQQATFLTDLMNAMDKILSGSLYADWFRTVQGSQIRRLQWIFCPGHAGVKGNERVDRLAGSATIEECLSFILQL